MKRFAALVLPLFLLVTLALAGCTATGGSGAGKSLTSGNVEDSRDVLAALNGAQTISLKKEAISLGDRWEVRVDGTLVATVRGEAIYIIGDTYSMYSVTRSGVPWSRSSPRSWPASASWIPMATWWARPSRSSA